MNLADIGRDAVVFVDTKILIYVSQGVSRQCRQLLDRIAGGAVRGVCSSVVLAELCHRSMINEARAKRLIVSSNPAKALSKKREVVRHLDEYAEMVRDILGGDLAVEAIRAEDFLVALELQKQHGMLTNDSLNLAVAKRLGIREIATADGSFDLVQGLIVYKPVDLATGQ